MWALIVIKRVLPAVAQSRSLHEVHEASYLRPTFVSHASIQLEDDQSDQDDQDDDDDDE